jgi:hypothetical protein
MQVFGKEFWYISNNTEQKQIIEPACTFPCYTPSAQ